MSTLASVALALTAGMPTGTVVSGPLANTSMSPGTAPVTGTAADDVTAATENAECNTYAYKTMFKDVVKWVTDEAVGLAAVTASASRVAPTLAVPTGGTIG